MRRSILILTLLTLLPSFSFAALIESSDIEDDGTWTVGTTALSFLSGHNFGISPTAGNDYFHFNSREAYWSGTNSIGFASVLQAGSYQATIDVGNFTNRAFPVTISLGMTAGGTLLAASASATPVPAPGAINTWTLDYSIDASHPLLGQSLGFEITVTQDGFDGNVSFDNLQIDFMASNSAPTAEAGANQSIHAGQTVFLDGTGSTDLETDAADLTYAWTFLSRPAGSTAAFSDAASATPSFVADRPGDYQIELNVTDEGGLSDSDQVTVTSENVPPQADAGADTVAIVGSLVTLDGGASSDADGDPLSYAWTLTASPAGSAAALVDDGTRFPSITPDVAGAYDVELVVDDGFESSLPDAVTVSAITPEEFALTVLMDVSNFIGDLPDSSFDKKQDRKKSTHEIAKTIDKIQKGQNEDAVHFIDKLIERADGCALRGSPDPHGGPFKHDFLTSCADQAEVYDGLVSARDALDPCAGVVCEASDPCHVAGTCSDGFCSDPVAPDGTACDDGDPATSDDVCTGGVCAGTGCVSDTAPTGECDPDGPLLKPCTTQNGDAAECAPGGICLCVGDF